MAKDTSIAKPLNKNGGKQGMHPNSLANLERGRKPWRNPKGRPPKGKCVTSLLRDLLEGKPSEVISKWNQDNKNLTGAMRIAIAMFDKMETADMKAISEGLDRVEGKVPQPIAGAEGGVPIKITYVQAEK